MKILLYFFFRLNKIIANNIHNEKSIFLNFYKNLFKTEKMSIKVLNDINNFFLFKNFFLSFFLKKKLSFKKKSKKMKKKFFFFKNKEKKINFFILKKSYFFFFKVSNFNFFNFFNFFFLSKIFLSVSLKNYLKIILNTDNKKILYSYFFLYLLKFRDQNSKNNFKFFNINKISDFWKFYKNILKKKNYIYVSDITFLTKEKNEKNLILKKKNINFLNYFINLNKKKNIIKTEINSYFFKTNTELKQNFIYLKKNKIYNKSKFARNKQTYRTGVFLCIWLTVLTVLGLYFYFYLISIKFTFIIIIFFSFIFSFFYKFYIKKKEIHWLI